MHDYEVLHTEGVFTGRVIAVRKDQVKMPGDASSQRDVVSHPGGVAVVAYDDGGQILLVQQYRHPVRRRLDEIPAGLLDSTGESALAAAERELAEETGHAADTWHVLADLLPDPAMTDEAIRIFLARDLHFVGLDRQGHEEAEMTMFWQPLETAVRRVFAGEIETAMAALGIVAAAQAARDGFAHVRPADSPWPSRKGHVV